MSDDAKVLDNYLAVWEDTYAAADLYCFLKELAEVPTFTEAARFREVIAKPTLDYSDLNDFYFDEDSVDVREFQDIVSNFSTRPFEVAQWVKKSRRVFRLSPQMQHAFENVSVAEIPASEITLPFESFLISLDTPIEYGSGRRISNILVWDPTFGYSIYDGSLGDEPKKYIKSLCLTAIDDKHLSYVPVSKKYRELAAKCKKTNDTDAAASILRKKYQSRIDRLHEYGSMNLCFSVAEGAGSLTHLRDITGKVNGDRKVMTIFFNLCLYLDALPTAEKTGDTDREWHKLPRVSKKPDVIRDGTQICDITGYHVLKSMSVNDSSKDDPSYSIGPHWRRGHSRRKPGEGDNPNAPKSIQVKPTLVRADLIPEYGLPRGSVSSVE